MYVGCDCRAFNSFINDHKWTGHLNKEQKERLGSWLIESKVDLSITPCPPIAITLILGLLEAKKHQINLIDKDSCLELGEAFQASASAIAAPSPLSPLLPLTPQQLPSVAQSSSLSNVDTNVRMRSIHMYPIVCDGFLFDNQ